MKDESKNDAPTGATAAAGCLWMIFGLLIVAPVLNGFVTVRLWAWFVVAWAHAPALTLAQAIGLHVVAGMFTPSSISTAKNDKTFRENMTTFTTYLFLRPAMALGMGAVVHWLAS